MPNLNLISFLSIVVSLLAIIVPDTTFAQGSCELPPTRIGSVMIVREPIGDDPAEERNAIDSVICGNGAAVSGVHSDGNTGMLGDKDYGVYGRSSTGHAGFFDGEVEITDDLVVGGVMRSNALIMLPHYSIAPVTCDSSNAGAMYFDTDIVALSGAQGACICIFNPTNNWFWSPTWQDLPSCD